MTSTVIYNDKLRTTALHVKSQTQIETDAPTDNEGKGERFSPTDLVATALASCMLTIMGIAATKRGLNIDGTTTEVEKVMASNPRRISEINIVMTMPKSENYSDQEKEILSNAALHCPVHKSLHADMKQNIEIIWP